MNGPLIPDEAISVWLEEDSPTESFKFVENEGFIDHIEDELDKTSDLARDDYGGSRVQMGVNGYK